MCSYNTSVRIQKLRVPCLPFVSNGVSDYPARLLMHLSLSVNVGILGATGYLTYSKWNRWDNRTFVTLAAGLASFGLGESYLVSHV
jgi:hypothetical protein